MKLYKTKNSSGFAVIELLIVLLVIGALVGVGLFVSRKKDSQNSDNKSSSSSNSNKTEAQLEIQNFGIASLDSIDVTTNATRDFTQSGHKGFYIFGDVLPGTPVRHNPNFEFASLKEGTKLISAIDGVVGFIKEQPDSKDSEVFLMPSEQSDWVIGYDHVTDLKVKKGDKVKVGDIIGAPARQNNGLLRFEFQINKNDTGQDGTHICPTTLLASSVKESWVKQLKSVQDDWEKTTGLELYDTSKQEPAGCLVKEMTPAYAQGTGQ